MTPEAQATARELVEDPRWAGERFDALPEPEIDDAWFRIDRGIRWVWEAGEWLPDLDDDATGGVILGMLGDGWCTARDDEDVRVWGQLCGEFFHGDTLGHAAGLALLASWSIE